MIVSFFKNSNPSALIILPSVGFLFWVNGLFVGHESLAHTEMPLYYLLIQPINAFPVLSSVIAFSIVIWECFLLNKIINDNELLGTQSYLTAFCYFIFMSFDNSVFTLHPIIIANFFIILTLKRVLDSYRKDRAYDNALDSGMLLAIATLFYAPSSILLLLLGVSLIIYRAVKWREWVIATLGFCIPFVFLQVFYFLTNQSNQLIYRAFYDDPTEYDNSSSLYFKVILFFVAVLIGLSLKSQSHILNGVAQQTKQGNKLFFWTLGFSGLMVLFLFDFSPISFTFIAVPASVICASYLTSLKRMLAIELLFLLFITTIIGNLVTDYL